MKKNMQLLIVGAAGLISMNARASILQAWLFNETAGVTLTNTINSAGSLNFSVNQPGATDGDGNFEISGGSATVNASVWQGFSSGSCFVGMDLKGWQFSTVGETIGIVVQQSGGGNARMLLTQTASGLSFQGWSASGSGNPASNLGQVAVFGSSAPLRIMIEMDMDADEYQIFWNYNNTGWKSSSTKATADTTIASGVHLQKSGDYTAAGDFVDIDRLQIANTTVIPEPATFLLGLAGTNPHLVL